METIKGQNIFFNFKELPWEEAKKSPHLVKDIKEERLHGFVTKGLFSQNEIDEILLATQHFNPNDILTVPTGTVFPKPFATLTDAGDMLTDYTEKANILRTLATKHPIIEKVLHRMDEFFKAVSGDFDTKVPMIISNNTFCAPGNFRFFEPDKGGLFVHCGYLFQKQSPFYYTVVEPMALERQLSFFLVLQNSEQGGELTIYDMLWKDIKDKDRMEENEYVLKPTGEKLYLNTLRSFSVKPKAGDVLIFSGGPIWHRVENIKGSTPRITFGGFLNFTPDGNGLRYWG
jgi:hypothetical protein